MTVEPATLSAYHLGFVVGDLRAATARYGKLFGSITAEFEALPVPFSDGSGTSAHLRVAFTRIGGLTIEFLQVLEGDADDLRVRWHREHGDGIQHIGFWVDDVRATAQSFLDRGASLLSARRVGADNVVLSLSAFPSSRDVLETLGPHGITYLDVGVGDIAVELVGKSNAPGILARLGDLAHLLDPPPP